MDFKELENALGASLDDSGPAQRVIECVRALPSIEPFKDGKGTMLGLAGGWRTLDATGIATSLVQRARLQGASIAIAELRRFLRGDMVEVRQSLLLAATRVSSPISLSEGLRLVPFNGSDVESARYIPGIPVMHHRDIGRITAAITKHHSCEVELSGPEQAKNPSKFSTALWDFDDLEDVRLCLSLIGPSGPAMVSTSIATVQWLPGESGSALGQHPHVGETRHTAIITAENADDLKTIHRKFIAQKAAVKKRLRIAMRRLNMSMCRRWDVDSAIDLGVALEVLFFDNPPAQSSIGYAIRLRAARFLRETLEERKTLARTVKDIYGIRSSAAHTGELPSGASTVMQEGARLVAEAIRAFIDRGEQDWVSVELG